MKKTIIIVMVICGAVFWYASGGTKGTEPIRIGSMAALTGVGSAIGIEENKGAQLAVEEINQRGGINGRKLELVSEDVSLDKIKNAVSSVQKLIHTDKVVALVGPQWDEPAGPILPVIKDAQVPTVGADNSDQTEKDIDNPFFFSTWYDNRVGVRELLRFAQQKGIRTIAIIRPVDSGFWKFTGDIMHTEASKYGVQIVEDVDMGNPLSLDFRTPISKIKQKNPDAVFIVTSDYNQCVFMKQVKEIGLNSIKLGTESAGDYISLKNCPELLENTYFSTPKVTEKGAQFNTAFKNRFGDTPKFPSAVTAYDAVYVIAEALQKTGGEGGVKLRDEIARIKMEGSAISDLSFNSKGFLVTPEDTFEMKTVIHGKFVPVNW
jgi:branched-chain amino acid transport system substrate-binding protein